MESTSGSVGWIVAVVVVLALFCGAALREGMLLASRCWCEGMVAARDGRAMTAPYPAKSWRATWWGRGWVAQDNIQRGERAAADRIRLEVHLAAFGGHRATVAAFGGEAAPSPVTALHGAETTYLVRSGWARDPASDHWAGEAWAAPWDVTYTLSRVAALAQQRRRDAEPAGKLVNKAAAS